jgi:hypothetical protein
MGCTKTGNLTNVVLCVTPRWLHSSLYQHPLFSIPFAHAFTTESYHNLDCMFKGMDIEEDWRQLVKYNKDAKAQGRPRFKFTILGDLSFLEKMVRSTEDILNENALIDSDECPLQWVYWVNQSADEDPGISCVSG